MTKIEYLSLSTPKRWAVSFYEWLKRVGLAIAYFFRNLPRKTLKFLKKCASPVLALVHVFRFGGWRTRTNFLIMGFSQLSRKHFFKGTLYLLYEIAFVLFMVMIGGSALSSISTLGTVGGIQGPDSLTGLLVWSYNDNSFEILLNSIFAIFLIVLTLVLWYSSIMDAFKEYSEKLIGKGKTDKDFIHDLVGSNYHFVMLGIPMVLLALFTIVPIVFMVIIGFTNFNSAHYPSQRLFDWVAWNNYSEVFSIGQDANGMVFLTTFGKVVLWTLIWAFFATFSNYFLGMIFALIINQKGIKLKKLWRTILITTIAVPQFVSLLIVSQMLDTDAGVINNILLQLGWIDKGIRWLKDPLLAKVMIIVVNTWVGIPYTMLICTGILMNIPEDLYESAKIDGASPFKMYMKITLPYMLFVTGPYLISQFVGNINNFNVIYLLTGGSPAFNFAGQNAPGILLNSNVGQTDLLITWIYKLTKDSPTQDFGTASVLGVFTFVVVAVISMVFYNRSSAVKNEEDFQ